MGMHLTPDTLRKIADTADAIVAAGIDVETFRVHGHKVFVKVSDSQRDGKSVMIKGITTDTGNTR